jgi:non-heme chloroperoxidase
MASISERENREIQAASASGNTPVVFIHGLWLLLSSWASWADFFQQAGYAPLTPDWPDDPQTVDQARANPRVLASKTLKQVADHTTEIITAGQQTSGHRALDRRLAGADARGPGPVGGHGGDRPRSLPRRPAPAGLRAQGVGPFLVNPLTRGRAITLTFGQFTYGWANALEEKEAKELYEAFRVAGSGISLAQVGNANLNPRTEAKVNTKNPAAVRC